MLEGRYLCTVILALLCCSHQALAGGWLSFLTLYSPSTISYGDNYYGSSVSTLGAFKFGNDYVYNVYVSTNGYFSLGVTPPYSLNDIPGPSSYSVVAPFAADIDTTRTGSVKYTQFITSDSQMNTVSSFIRSETGNSFYGTRMMVAEWNGVPRDYGSTSTTNTFQGILITDSISSYAVFIYDCDNMEWGGGVIGWQEGSSQYNSHYLSGDSDSNDIGCLYSTTYSAVVFKIDDVSCSSSQFKCYSGECVSGSHRCTSIDSCSDGSDEDGCTTTAQPTTSSCYSYEFTCDNGDCEPESYVCDGYDDCGDYSDEVGCDGSDSSGSSSGLAVGLTVALLFLLIFIGIPICVGVIMCYSTNRRSHRPLRTRIVATTPASGATVVTSNQATSMTNPSLYAQPQYPQQPQPPVLYTQPQYPQQPQQPVYKDAQLSFQEAPPSYDAVTAAANPTQQIPLQNVPYPVQNQAYPGYPSAGPPPNQAYPPPTAPPPHGNVNNAGYLLQE